MKTSMLSLIVTLVPAALCAQVSAQATANGEVRAPASFSAQGAAKLNAMYAEAKEHHVPREPMERRVAEGRAKGASEETIISSAGKVKFREEATQEAMIAGGRKHPSDEEMERGASAMERGVTKVQIKALAQNTRSDRSLVVAFDVLAKLAARGVPVGRAVAQVQSNITSGASDATLSALVATAGSGPNAAAGANGSATTATKPIGGTLSTTVGGVLKKP